MISHLRGIVHKGMVPGEVTIDVHGIGYRVSTPVGTWDELQEGATVQLHITTYVREDRLDLFGFADVSTRTLFEELIDISGIGPRTALELCGVPRGLLSKAIYEADPELLTSIKGIGRKTAEKLLLELRSVMDKHPHVFSSTDGSRTDSARFDPDTIAALTQLGFSTQDILRVLEHLPKDLTSTEQRVEAALRKL